MANLGHLLTMLSFELDLALTIVGQYEGINKENLNGPGSGYEPERNGFCQSRLSF